MIMELVIAFPNADSTAAVSAIAGSIVGALGSSVSAWIAQKHQDRREIIARKISQREQLYAEFINEGARLHVDALQHTFEDPTRVVPMHALLSRIRLTSSAAVVESAERAVENILNIYSEPNLTAEQIQSGRAQHRVDPLLEFSEVCRAELESF
jgi:hypothetical protein